METKVELLQHFGDKGALCCSLDPKFFILCLLCCVPLVTKASESQCTYLQGKTLFLTWCSRICLPLYFLKIGGCHLSDNGSSRWGSGIMVWLQNNLVSLTWRWPLCTVSALEWSHLKYVNATKAALTASYKTI